MHKRNCTKFGLLGVFAGIAGGAAADGTPQPAADQNLLSFDLGTGVQSILDAGQMLQKMIEQLPEMPSLILGFLSGLEQFGFQPTQALVAVVLCGALAVLGEHTLRRIFRRMTGTNAQAPSPLIWRGLMEFAALLAFGLLLYFPLLILLRNDPVATAIMVASVPPVLALRVAEAVLRGLLGTTTAAEGRAVEPGRVKRLIWSFISVATLATIAFVSAALFAQGGMDEITLLSFVLVSRLVVTISVVLALLGNKTTIKERLVYRRDGSTRGAGWQRFAASWHLIAAAYIGLSFLATSLLLLTGFAQANAAALASFLVIVLAILLALSLDSAVQNGVSQDKSGLLHDLARRVGMPTILGGAVIAFFWIWLPIWSQIPIVDLSPAARGALLQVGVTAFLTFLMWQTVDAISQHFGMNPAKASQDISTSAPGTRFGTLVPLFKIMLLIGLVFVSAISVLSAIGVDVLPLFAGAGIVGLAVGLGSQTLVRDVVSGIFFLIDDAFRIGEYVDVGIAKGTVESVSIRSMRLRHHLGTVHTVPYGEIKTIANMTRDWVVMRVEFRVPFDVDTEKLRKKIKALGKELLLDPEIGQKFIEPLKSNGVIGIEEAAMIIRCKFTTRPGHQWELRRRVYDELRALFEREGITVAARQVQVRATDEKPAEREGYTVGAEAAFDQISDGS